jgi:WD40 repeat protein
MGDEYVAAVSPDGKLIASACRDELFVTVWDIQKRGMAMKLDDHRVNPVALAWSHNGKMIAVARGTEDKRGPVVYDLATKKPKVLAKEYDELIESIAFSPDDRMMAVHYDNAGLSIWDIAAGKEWQTIDRVKVSGGRGVRFSPDGGVLGTFCESLRPASIKLWDVSKYPGGKGVAKLPPGSGVKDVQDDRFVRELEQAIRGNFDSRNIESLKVEMLGDGTVVLTGKVTSGEVKRVAGRTAEVHRARERGLQLNKVDNKLEVTGRIPR